MAVTFEVSKVRRGRSPLPVLGSDRGPLDEPVEAYGISTGPLVEGAVGQCAVLCAAELAFARHHPLVLTPDVIWLCVAQGFARHVNVHDERLRPRFVRHEGQLKLLVSRVDIAEGSAQNPWPSVLRNFSDLIAQHIGRSRDLLVCDFSTTGVCERAASEIVLMDAMKVYFKYELGKICGIPEITLEGTLSDWESVRKRARVLSEYDLAWWVDALLPVLDQFVAAAEGRADAAFWQRILRPIQDDLCVRPDFGTSVTGWINVLFPYLEVQPSVFETNPWVDCWEDVFSGRLSARLAGRKGQLGLHSEVAPSGLSRVPFKWVREDGTKRPMELLGGFVGVAQDQATLALRPAIGWAVRGAPTPGVGDGIRRVYRFEPSHPDRRGGSAGLILIAGRVSRERAFTYEQAALVDQIVRRKQEELKRDLVCVFSRDFPEIEGAPDATVTGRLIVGMGIGDVDAGRAVHHGPIPVEKLRIRLDKANALPASLWDDISAALTGSFHDETAIILTGYGPLHQGALLVGEIAQGNERQHVHVNADGARAVWQRRLDEETRALRDHALLREGREPSQEELDRVLRRLRSRSPHPGVLGVEVAGVGVGGADHAIVDISPDAHECRVEAARAVGVITEPYYHLMTWAS
jgi:Domain of unknown function (DUF4419)